MRSPVAPEVEMLTISIEGITIDQCPKSGGHWLDRGELAKLARHDDAESPLHESGGLPGSTTIRICPRDGEYLQEIEFPMHSGLRVDVCPKCGGIWLDQAELSRALTLMNRPPADPLEPGQHAPPPHSILSLLARLFRHKDAN